MIELLNTENLNRFLTVLSLLAVVYCVNAVREETSAFEHANIELRKSVDAIQIDYNNLRFKALRDSSIGSAATLRVVNLLSNTLNNVVAMKEGKVDQAAYIKNTEDLMMATERELVFQKERKIEQDELLDEVVALQKRFSEVKFSTIALVQQQKRLNRWKIIWTLGIIIGTLFFITGLYIWQSIDRKPASKPQPLNSPRKGRK